MENQIQNKGRGNGMNSYRKEKIIKNYKTNIFKILLLIKFKVNGEENKERKETTL